MIVAVIGSRDLPPEHLQTCRWIGRRLVERGHAIVSGNAPGADQAYAAGANEVRPDAVTLCLPWLTFERHAIHPANRIVVARLGTDESRRAEAACPRWRSKTNPQRLLLTRDVMIVDRADNVIAYPWGPGNGTRFTMGLAMDALKQMTDLSDPGRLAACVRQLTTT